jgi:hypothetical protein
MRCVLAASLSISLLSIGGAAAASDQELKEMTALLINAGGNLCASVTEIHPLRLADQYEVTCIEYRGGVGTVRYIFNAKTGKAFKAG